MANKKSTTKKAASKKTTAKKATKKPVASTVAKKAQKVSYRDTKNSEKSVYAPSKWLLLGLAAGWGFLAYGFASWAIDSGSLWHYLFTFTSFYFLVSYLQRFAKVQFRK